MVEPDPFADELHRDLFEADALPRVALPLEKPIEVSPVSAVLHSQTHLTFDGLTIQGPFPITMLCGALRAVGHPDHALRVVDRTGSEVMLIQSFYNAAAVGAGEA